MTLIIDTRIKRFVKGYFLEENDDISNFLEENVNKE